MKEGGKVTKPTPDPTKEGFDFDAWYKEDGLENKWNFDTETVKGDMNLYAGWTPDGSVEVYTVTFVSNGGSAVATQTVAEGAKVTKPTPDPTKEDFDFDAWYKEEALENEWDFDTETVTGDMNLYAGWT